ncbi:hypothetical protein IWX78_000432 [Mycetocola sp. CAN_C7]|uniref:DUF3618 domain-containing protein n=1 Tax=Mycetocola sp. CAN_C7 TaxID=2787724 RepID=UPI0018CB6C4C
MSVTSSTEQARAELASTLNAIEDKLNVPRKVNRAIARGKVTVARLQRDNPAALAAGIAAVAVTAGAAAWAITRALVRR